MYKLIHLISSVGLESCQLTNGPSSSVCNRDREEIQHFVAGLDRVSEGVEGRQLDDARPVPARVQPADGHDESV